MRERGRVRAMIELLGALIPYVSTTGGVVSMALLLKTWQVIAAIDRRLMRLEIKTGNEVAAS
jgi:hypothetical protein